MAWLALGAICCLVTLLVAGVALFLGGSEEGHAQAVRANAFLRNESGALILAILLGYLGSTAAPELTSIAQATLILSTAAYQWRRRGLHWPGKSPSASLT